MKAVNTSHTVGLAKPDSAQRRDSSAALKPGFAISAGPNRTQGASTVTSTTPVSATAGPGSGSTTRPAITAEKSAK